MSLPQTQPYQAKILVVDDKPENIHLLSQTLTNHGYEVRGVVNGTMAIRVATSAQPDLILLDIMMPDLSGYEVCRKLKANEKTQNIPIIFLSANNNTEGKVEAFNAGGVDYINKPFQIDEVLTRIKHQLDLKIARAQIHQLNEELEIRIQERTAQLKAANQELEKEIIERRQVSRLLQESEERLHNILNSLEEVVWSVDGATRQLKFLNLAAHKVYGRPATKLLENPELRLQVVHPEDRPRVKEQFEKLEEHNSIDVEYRILQPGGKVRWLWERSKLVHDNNQIVRLDGIICDITDRKIFEQKLSYEARHDALTGLSNRVFFMEKVEQVLQKIKYDKNYLFAVLFIDLDRFKIVNDSLGHVLGDQLLIGVANLLKESLRPQDIIARLGGDEFTILVKKVTHIEDITIIANRILKKLMSPFNLEGHQVFTGASIGIVFGNCRYQNSTEILRDADIAMYRAKAEGKGRYEVFDREMYAQTLELLQLENDLRHGIENGEFILHYQPIISTKTGNIRGFEALVRWQHPQKGLVFPDKFIHLAEETGLIIPLGEWVLIEACQQLHQWQVKYPNAAKLKMSVNLASQQMIEPDFIVKLVKILQEAKIPPNSLNLEITETTLMDYGEKTIDLLNQIRDKKIQLSIDDFGTGYSSLRYLHRFPINHLKIDRSFINGITVKRENFEIVRTIVTLAHTLGIHVVAEGVE
ncbi:MAG: EAL domain-containing protein, partial [Xenococcus sp. (in: cyanobacteria)]